jgi:urease accessory protein
MSANASLSERTLAAVAPPRAEGALRLAVARMAGVTFVRDVEEAGPLRVCFPRPATKDILEAVILNTGGGVVSGDRLRLTFEADEGASLTVTTQAAERVYRSDGATARVELRLVAARGARLCWLPQETIVYDGARIERTIGADVAADAALTLCEALVFGRTAMGETLVEGCIADRWRIRRGGTLVFADALRLEGPIGAILGRPAVAAGARAAATLVRIAPDAEAGLAPLRTVLAAANVEAGASAFDGLLVARLLARDGLELRAGLGAAFSALGVHLPRAFVL